MKLVLLLLYRLNLLLEALIGDEDSFAPLQKLTLSGVDLYRIQTKFCNASGGNGELG